MGSNLPIVISLSISFLLLISTLGTSAIAQTIDNIISSSAIEACRIAIAHAPEPPEPQREREAEILSTWATEFRSGPARGLHVNVKYRADRDEQAWEHGECTVIWPYFHTSNGTVTGIAYPVFDSVVWRGQPLDSKLLQSAAYRIHDLIELK